MTALFNNSNNIKTTKTLALFTTVTALLLGGAVLGASNFNNSFAWAQDVSGNEAGTLSDVTPAQSGSGGGDGQATDEVTTTSNDQGDKNCKDYLPQTNFPIDPNNDPYNLDRDNDGFACESGWADVEPTITPETTTTTEATAPVNESVVEEEQPAVQPTEQPAATPVPVEEVLGNAISIEQVGIEQFTQECLQQLFDASITIVQGAFVLGDNGNDDGESATTPVVNEEVITAVNNASEEVATQVQEQLPADTQTALENETSAIAEDAQALEQQALQQGHIYITTDANGATLFHIVGVDQDAVNAAQAVEQAATPEAVIEEIAQDAIVEQVIEETGVQDEVAAAAGDAVETVLSGDATPAEAAGNFTEDIQSIANDTASEVTPDMIEEAASNSDVVEEVIQDVTEATNTGDSGEGVVTEEAVIDAAVESNNTNVTTDAATGEGVVDIPASDVNGTEVTADEQVVTDANTSADTSVIEDAVIDAATDNVTEQTVKDIGQQGSSSNATVYDELQKAQAALDTVRGLLFG